MKKNIIGALTLACVALFISGFSGCDSCQKNCCPASSCGQKEVKEVSAPTHDHADEHVAVSAELAPVVQEPLDVRPAVIQENQTMLQGKEMAENNSGVVTTPSGLQYIILKPAPADAKSPKSRKVVTVHYTGWLDKNGEKGAKFDSSVDRGMPFQFVIGAHQVIAGWDEGVMGMKVGEERRLIIPANLGYGNRNMGSIPAGSTLIFDVTLLDVAE
ncbi:MAG TPA: FKBP-type peptidyl-prolyl cis-trans isomerase [Candidatus Babeliales bacterium]|nr:FKBP-type peptidyl-prolyl cis-trans isomerase [Candidatus Babeliales bacterium]